MLQALAEAGAPAASVWTWVNGTTPAAAVPVLVDWLGRIGPEHAQLREGMVRALTTRAARPVAAATVAAEMKRQAEYGADWNTLWAYGNALAVLADDSAYDQVAALAADRSLGRGREMLTAALAKMRSAGATDVLVGLLGDPEVDGHAVVALARRVDAPAEVLESYVDDPRPWVRRAARRSQIKQA